MALDAFAVTNRKDVYVLQDVQETGEESIFYLKSVLCVIILRGGLTKFIGKAAKFAVCVDETCHEVYLNVCVYCIVISE